MKTIRLSEDRVCFFDATYGRYYFFQNSEKVPLFWREVSTLTLEAIGNIPEVRALVEAANGLLEIAETLYTDAEMGQADNPVEVVKSQVTRKAEPEQLPPPPEEQAQKMLERINERTGKYYKHVDHLLNAIRIELGDEDWTWPEGPGQWTRAANLAMAHAEKNQSAADLWGRAARPV